MAADQRIVIENCAIATVDANDTEYASGYVVINGNRKIKDEKLVGLLRSQSLGPYSETSIEADKQTIRDAYAAIGRSDATVTTQTYPLGNGRVNLAFVVDEGDRTKISQINFVGNQAYSNGRLQSVIVTKKSNFLSFLTRKDVYSEEITVNYGQSQQPSTYLTDLYTAVGSGDSSPWDVMAIEENYWAEVQLRSTQESIKLMEDFLPSGLIPNADRVLDNFKHLPTSIAFQASATPGIRRSRRRSSEARERRSSAVTRSRCSEGRRPRPLRSSRLSRRATPRLDTCTPR